MRTRRSRATRSQGHDAETIFARNRRNQMTTIQAQVPDSLYQQVAEFAARENMTVEQVISQALAQALRAWSTQDEIKERARRGSREKFLEFMAQMPDIEPPDYDRL